MTRRKWLNGTPITLGVVLTAVLLAPAPAEAQIYRVQRGDARHAIGFNLGYFALRGEDSRVDEDVLLADLPSLLFEVDDFNGFTFGGEWVYGLSDYLETGVGVGFYQNTVTSVYRDFEDIDGTEIVQDLKLRIVPITGTIRFLPIGRRAAVVPYVGGGIGVFNWRYSETGEFIDFTDNTIFRDQFTSTGTDVGPVILGGLRAAVGDAAWIGGEIRWQQADGNTGGLSEGFLGEKIDLGGWTTSFTVHFRF